MHFCHYSWFYTLKSEVLVLSFYWLVCLTCEEMTPLAFSSNHFFHHPSFPEFWRIFSVWTFECVNDGGTQCVVCWSVSVLAATNTVSQPGTLKNTTAPGRGNTPENFSVAHYFYSFWTFSNKSIRCVEPVFHLNEETPGFLLVYVVGFSSVHKKFQQRGDNECSSLKTSFEKLPFLLPINNPTHFLSERLTDWFDKDTAVGHLLPRKRMSWSFCRFDQIRTNKAHL